MDADQKRIDRIRTALKEVAAAYEDAVKSGLEVRIETVGKTNMADTIVKLLVSAKRVY